jgi:outer membrane receptor for ferrienterochelin and colicins
MTPSSLGLLLLLAAGTPPAGESSPDTSDLEGLLDAPVISGASSGQESSSDAPATATVVTAEQMRVLGLRSLDEAINFLSMGMNVQNPLHSVEVGARGVLLSGDFGNHVLVRIDGHAMNEQWEGTTYFEQGLALPIEAIDHIEIIVGPGSVLYGGNAMLGIINIVTRRVSDRPGLLLVAEGGLSPSQGSQGNLDARGFAHPGGAYRLGAGWAGEFSLFGMPSSVVAHTEWYAQDGPTFLFGPQSGTDGLIHDFGPRSQSRGVWGGKAGYYTQVPALYTTLTVADLTVRLHLASYQRSTPYLNPMNNPLTDFNDPNSFERDRWLQLDVRWHRQLSRQFAATARVYGDDYSYYSQDVASDPLYCTGPNGVTAPSCVNGLAGQARWGGLELQGNWDWTGSGTLTTLLGSEVRVRRVQNQTAIKDVASGADLGSTASPIYNERVLSVYLQQRASPLQFLHLNAGARFDRDSRGGNNISPRAAAVVDLWKGGTAKLIYSTGYRVPSIYETYYAGPTQAPASGLHSEKVYSIEASLEQRYGRMHLLVGGFRSWWRNLIKLSQLPDGRLQFENGAFLDNYGLEAAFSAAFEPLSLGMTVTVARTRAELTPGETDESDTLSVSPQIFGNGWVALALPRGHAASFAVSAVGRRPADRAFDGNFPSVPYAPAAAQLKLTFTGPLGLLRGLEYRAGLDFNTGRTVPYVAGPNQVENPVSSIRPAAELASTVRFTVFAGLQLRFWP